jgi:Protein of unknown function (DUF4240)
MTEGYQDLKGRAVELEAFWQVIEAAKKASGGDCQQQARLIVDTLSELDAKEILAFNRILNDLMDKAYRWDLWGAADLINRGCSDDGFEDFRGWLVAQGRNVYEKALLDPDSLADHPAVSNLGEFDTLWCQELLAAPFEAYEKITGNLPPDEGLPAVLIGERWDFDDETIMRRRYPRLWALVRSQ